MLVFASIGRVENNCCGPSLIKRVGKNPFKNLSPITCRPWSKISNLKCCMLLVAPELYSSDLLNVRAKVLFDKRERSWDWDLVVSIGGLQL